MLDYGLLTNNVRPYGKKNATVHTNIGIIWSFLCDEDKGEQKFWKMNRRHLWTVQPLRSHGLGGGVLKSQVSLQNSITPCKILRILFE